LPKAFAPDGAATKGEKEGLMSDDKPALDPAKALADIRTLARVALESADPVVMRRDLELILTITEETLQPRDQK
jgi:hypothetical protein